MINDMGKVYSLKITSFSPIHIGDVVSFEPTGYVIGNPDKVEQPVTKPASSEETLICPECGYANPLNKVRGNPYCLGCDTELELPSNTIKNEPNKFVGSIPLYLYTFTPKQLTDSLSDAEKKQLLEVARSGNFYRLEEFFKNKTGKIMQNATKHASVCPEIAKQYYQKYGNEDAQKGKENKFDIEKNISNPVTGLAYIPGSSLKGAVRTALMSEHNKSLHLNTENCKSGQQAEKQLYNYNTPMQDPFKYLKIGDTTPQCTYLSEIRIARNYKRRSGQSQMPVYIEVIPHNTVFTTELMLARNVLADEMRELPDNMTDIKEACNNFYGKIFKEEQSMLLKHNLLPMAYFDGIKQALQKPDTFLLRVGKHIGAESITIEDLRRIRNHKSKEYMDHSTTFWLAENGTEKLPFGWCVVEFSEVR